VLEPWPIASFAGRLGEQFRIGGEDEGTSTDAELIEANQLGGPPPGGGRAPFSLVFLATSDEVLPQRIYRVDHAELGALDIFLVPIGADAAGVRYEAVFT